MKKGFKMEELLNIAKNAFPSVSGSEKVKGIQEDVEILWDKWGIPHIYANSVNDEEQFLKISKEL